MATSVEKQGDDTPTNTDSEKSSGLPDDIPVVPKVDALALAEEAAKLEAMVESFETNLEVTEQDLHLDDETWTKTSRMSTVGKDINFEMADEDEGVKEMKEAAAAELDSLRKAEESQQSVEEKHNTGQEKSPKTGDGPEMEVEDMDADKHEEESIQDDMSIDDSVDSSDRSSSSMHDSSKSVSNASTSAHSAASLSLDQIHKKSVDADSALYSEELLLQHGIFRIDESSKKQALICDWNKWRKYKKAHEKKHPMANDNNHMDSSSERWGDLSFHDSNLKMPLRRKSDSTLGTRSSARTSDKDMDVPDNIFAGSESEDENDDDESITFFDWKAWRRKQHGQRSSTSNTGSFSMSNNDSFDETSVLAKLDQWESMEIGSEEAVNNNNSEHDDDHKKHEDEAPKKPERSISRSSSEILKRKNRAPPTRSLSNDNIQSSSMSDLNGSNNTLNIDWKHWQIQQRRKRMSDSWSNLSGNLNTDRADSDDSSSRSHDDDEFEDPESNNNHVKPQPEDSAAKSPRSMKKRSSSLRLKPLGSPQRSPVEQMGDWKSWQREKRRSGMMKTASNREMWNIPLTVDDSSNERPSLEQRSKSEKWDRMKSGCKDNSEKRRNLQRARSEQFQNATTEENDRWASDKASKSDHAPSVKEKLRRAHSENWGNAVKASNLTPDPSTKSAEDFFDWKLWRRDKRRSLRKSKSEQLKSLAVR